MLNPLDTRATVSDGFMPSPATQVAGKLVTERMRVGVVWAVARERETESEKGGERGWIVTRWGTQNGEF
jgi:hypothetical protein